MDALNLASAAELRRCGGGKLALLNPVAGRIIYVSNS